MWCDVLGRPAARPAPAVTLDEIPDVRRLESLSPRPAGIEKEPLGVDRLRLFVAPRTSPFSDSPRLASASTYSARGRPSRSTASISRSPRSGCTHAIHFRRSRSESVFAPWPSVPNRSNRLRTRS